jgi:hypothetical protein
MSKLKNAVECYSVTDQVVLGTNPENADYDNPTGNIYGWQAFVIVEAKDGSRWTHVQTRVAYRSDDAERKVRSLVDRVNAAIGDGIELNPDLWIPSRPVYMSEAYIREGCELDQLELEIMQEKGC